MMKRKVTYGIGQGVDKDGRPMEGLEEKRQLAYALIAGVFGGFTATLGKGGWIDPRGKLVLEDSLTITSYTDDTSKVDAVGEYLRQLFEQESVLVAVEPAEVRFVEAPQSVPSAPQLQTTRSAWDWEQAQQWDREPSQ